MSAVRQVADRAWRRLPDPAKNAAKSAWAGYAKLTAGGRLLPDFLVIGTQRGGTTSLYKYLSQHPGLARALTKEVRYFDLNYHRGLGWYRSRFPSARHRERVRKRTGVRLVVGEASPDYMFHPHAPRRVARALPGVKLVVMLRNPVDRAWSHYWHQFKMGHETLAFDEAIRREPERLQGELEKMLADERYVSYERHHHSYLARGVYAEQLRTWLDLFPPEQLLIERSEDFFQDPAAAFRRVQAFVGLSCRDLAEYETFNAYATGAMDPELRSGLLEFFRPHNEALEVLLDRPFHWDR